MNKKGTKKLSGALAATTVLTSVAGATPAFAKGTDWDAIYKTAYEAMVKAEKEKTQESINAARKAIGDLAKNKQLFTMASTFSEKVDGVQQGLFNDLYALMYVNGKEKDSMTQKEVNKAKALVISFATYEGNKPYITSWSSAIDKYQDKIYDNAKKAVETAEKTKKLEDIKNARVLVDEFLAVTNADMKKVAEGLDARLAKLEKETIEFSIESVNAVNIMGEKVALNGATVSRNSTYEIKFNQAFDTETITSTTIKLVKGNETMAISQPTTDKNVVSFRSLSTLDAGAEYKLVVDGIKSKDGKTVIKNKTLATFKAAETVVTKKVTANATKIFDSTSNEGVSLNVKNAWTYGKNGSAITVQFDTPVDKSTINSSSVQLVDVVTGKNIAVEGNQDPNTNYLEVKVVGTKDYLIPKKQYKLVLNNLKAANGKIIDNFQLTFAYQAPAPRELKDATIYNGDLNPIGTNVKGLVNPLTTQKMLDDSTTFKAAAAVTVDFGADQIRLDKDTVTTDYLYIREKDSKKKVAQTISYNKELNRVTLTPTERLKDDTSYEIFESPYLKNIYGVTVGDKDNDYKTTEFKTLDVSAPKMVGQVESTLENKELSNLPLDRTFKIRVKMSEKINNATKVAGTGKDVYTKFATGNINGNVLVTRADDESIAIDAINENFVTVEKEILGKDTYVTLRVDPTKVSKKDSDNLVKGKTFRVTLAGYNPMRTNDSNKVITDDYSIAKNSLENDYTFTFTFEGEDKTAPKVTGIKGSYNGNDLATPIQGMTNVNANKMRIYFDCNDVKNESIKNIKLFTKNHSSNGIAATLIGAIAKTGSTSYADVKFEGADAGAATLKIQDVEDMAGNKSSLQSYDLTIGNGPKVSKAQFVKASAPEQTKVSVNSQEAVVRLDLNGEVDKTTLTGNIKVLDGKTEVPVTVDSKNLEENGYVLLIPKTPLKGNTEYTVQVNKSVKDVNGNALQQDSIKAPADYSVKLKTKVDSAPVLKEKELDEKDKNITVKFDQDVTNARISIKSASGDIVIINGKGKYVDDKVNKSDVKFELGKLLKGNGSLNAGTTYIVTVEADGLDGNGVLTGKSATVKYDIITKSKISADQEAAKPNYMAVPTIKATGKLDKEQLIVKFDKPVGKLDESAFKVVNMKDGKSIDLAVGYSVKVAEGANKVLDKDGNTIGADKFVISLPVVLESDTKLLVTLNSSSVKTVSEDPNATVEYLKDNKTEMITVSAQ